MWLTPHLRDPQPEGERERERERQHIIAIPRYALYVLRVVKSACIATIQDTSSKYFGFVFVVFMALQNFTVIAVSMTYVQYSMCSVFPVTVTVSAIAGSYTME